MGSVGWLAWQIAGLSTFAVGSMIDYDKSDKSDRVGGVDKSNKSDRVGGVDKSDKSDRVGGLTKFTNFTRLGMFGTEKSLGPAF